MTYGPLNKVYAMSAKSDRDNRSNQLNPNSDAYWNSRRHTDHDDDGDQPERSWRERRGRIMPEPPEWLYGEYFMAIVAFDGNTRHVRFRTKVSNGRGPHSAGGGIVESVWYAQLHWMVQECRLGIAYARIAGLEQGQDPKYRRVIWNTPNIDQSQLEREKVRLSAEKERLKRAEDRMHASQQEGIPPNELAFFRSLASICYHSTFKQVRNLSDVIARAEAWYSDVHDLAEKFERMFEMEDHAGGKDLGVLTEEIELDAPNPYLGRAGDANL